MIGFRQVCGSCMTVFGGEEAGVGLGIEQSTTLGAVRVKAPLLLLSRLGIDREYLQDLITVSHTHSRSSPREPQP